MSTKVLVTGANGRTGRAMLAALTRRGATVRAFIRNATQQDALRQLGAAEFAIGDMLAPATISPAVSGCDVVIHIGPPMHPDEKTIAGRFLAAARAGGVKRFVYYSVMHPLRREVPHHARKLDTEEMVIESGLPYTIVQPTRYMQHLELIWKNVIATGVHAMAFNTHVKLSVADVVDLAEATACVATEDGHLYATYEMAGPEALSQDDMAGIIGEVIGKPVSARQLPLDEMAARAKAAGASDDRIDTMRKMNAHYDRSGFLGNPNILRWLLGREPTGFRAYVERLARRDGLIPNSWHGDVSLPLFSRHGESPAARSPELGDVRFDRHGEILRGPSALDFGVTEPNAGTDTSRITTRAEKKGDRWIVSGRKVWTSNAQRANKILLLARTSDRDPQRPLKGMTLFFTDFDRTAMTVREIEKLGRAAVDSNEVFITAELMCMKAAWLFDTGRPCGREANAAKLMAAEAGFNACDVALQTFGGYGYAKEFHVERLWREVRLYKIAPISQQMALNYLAEHVLGLPRSY